MCDFRCQIRWLASKSQVTSVGQFFSKLKEKKNIELRTKSLLQSIACRLQQICNTFNDVTCDPLKRVLQEAPIILLQEWPGASWRLPAKFFNGSHVTSLKVFLPPSEHYCLAENVDWHLQEVMWQSKTNHGDEQGPMCQVGNKPEAKIKYFHLFINHLTYRQHIFSLSPRYQG